MSTQTLDKAKANLPVRGFLKIDDLIIPKGEDLVKAILDLKKEKNSGDFGALLSTCRNSGYCGLSW
jgi:hypothetical protein